MTIDKGLQDSLDGLKEMVGVLLEELYHLSDLDERVRDAIEDDEHINEAGRFAMTTLGELVSERIDVALKKFEAIVSRTPDG